MSNVVDYILNLRDNLSPALTNANNQAKNLESSLGGVQSMALKLGAAFGISLGIGEIFKLGMDVEQTRIQFDVLLGSQEKSIELREKMTKYANTTPYEKGDIMDAAKMMLSFGITQESIMPNMKMIGDIAMGNKDKLNSLTLAFSQVSSAGKLQGQDMLQMINSGFNPLQEMVKMTGKSMATLRKEMENGQISSQMVAEAFKHATSEGGLFFGMTDKIGQTAMGKLSTLIDSLKEKMLILYDAVADPFMQAIDMASAGLDILGSFLQSTIGFIKEHATMIGFLAGTYVTYKGIMLTVMLAEKAHLAIKAASLVVSELMLGWDLARASGLGILTSAQWALNVAMNANPIGLIITGVAALIAGVIALSAHFGGFGNMLKAVWEIAKVVASGIANVFKSLGEVILGVLTLNPKMIASGLQGVVGSVKNAATEIATIWNAPAKEKSLLAVKGEKGDTGIAKPNKPATVIETPKTKAEGQKTINIHVAYNAPLIKDFSIHTNNIQEGMGHLRDKVSAILTGATHDAHMVADY